MPMHERIAFLMGWCARKANIREQCLATGLIHAKYHTLIVMKGTGKKFRTYNLFFVVSIRFHARLEDVMQAVMSALRRLRSLLRNSNLELENEHQVKY